MTNEEMIWNTLYSELKNPYGTAGLMGNLFAESSLNPKLANKITQYGLTNEAYTRLTDLHKDNNFITDGIAYGLAQWRYHTRKKGLLDKAITERKSVGDLDLQLSYLLEELKSYKTVDSTLRSAKTIREASDIVLLKYEKPANTSEAIKNKRAGFGEKYFTKYFRVTTKLSQKTIQELKNELEKRLR